MRIFLTLLLSFVLALSSVPVSARISEAEQEAFDRNDIRYYNPDITYCNASVSGTQLTSGYSNFQNITQYFKDKGSTDYAIAGILGNFWGESALSAFRIQSQASHTSVNLPPPAGLGYGIAQFTPSTKIGSVLKSDTRTKEYYEKYFSTKYGGGLSSDGWGDDNVPAGVTTDVNLNWLAVQLDYIYEGELSNLKVGSYRNVGGSMGLDYIDNGDTLFEAMNKAKNEVDAARLFIWIYERPADKPGGAIKRGKYATEMLSAVQGVTGGVGSSNSGDSCADTLASTTDGDLISTVQSFAWASGVRSSKQKKAYAEYIKTASYKGGKGGNDCGAFVMGVMRASGYDPEFPSGPTGSMLSSLESSSTWEKIASVGGADESQLKPGDVGIRDGHVLLWVGDGLKATEEDKAAGYTGDKFNGKSVEAAVGSNTAPTAITSGNTYSKPSGYNWFRKSSGGEAM